jgi:tRNA(Ile)-lysidine synthase
MAGDPAAVGDLLARCTFPAPGTDVVCAFSGGADSTALLVLAKAAALRVSAIHVDHRLRPSSATEATAAAALAATLGVACQVVVIDVPPGSNLEARARAARLAALPAGALTGHTADDRAETLLVNLLRGAGLDGLSAMAPGPTRPLLALRRAETHRLCDELGLVPVRDPSNDDPRFVRNRVRHELLPLMDAIAGRDTVPLLVRTAETAAGDVALAESAAAGLDPTDARAITAADPAAARRALRRWLTIGGYPPDAATVNRVLAVAAGTERACEMPGGRRIERHRQRLRIVDGGAVSSPDGMSSTGAR